MDLEKFEAWRATKSPRLLNELVKENDLFACQQCHKLCRTYRLTENEDLLQACRIGLFKAFEKYDPGRGAFTTYAAHWIRDQFQKAASKDVGIYRPIGSGLPVAVQREMERIKAVTGRDATAGELGISEGKLVDWRLQAKVIASLDTGGMNQFGPTVHVNGMMSTNVTNDTLVIDLERQHRDDALNAEERLGNAECELLALELVDTILEPQERALIKALFVDEKTVATVAQQFKMSPNTILEMRDAALAKLRKGLDQ